MAMKKMMIVFLTVAGMLSADASMAACKCSNSKKRLKHKTVGAFSGYKKKTTACSSTSTVSNMKRETTGVFYGYRAIAPLEEVSRTTYITEVRDDEASVHPTSGIGVNSSDNYKGLVNNGSLGSNGTSLHGTDSLFKDIK